MTSPYSFSLAKEKVDSRLILQHDTFVKLLDDQLLHTSVSEPPKDVLDIGTGCGIWAAEFATRHPSAQVIGIDNWPQPQIAVPDNCQLISQDAEQEWQFGTTNFDIIHTRLVPFHAKEVPGVLRRCYENLKPGGFIEMQEVLPPPRTDEPVGSPDRDSKFLEWSQLRKEAASVNGVDHGITGSLSDALREAGFEEVQSSDLKLPIGAWMEDERMKEVGRSFAESIKFGMMDLSFPLLTNVGMDENQIKDLVQQAEKELGTVKIYSTVRILLARKTNTS